MPIYLAQLRCYQALGNSAEGTKDVVGVVNNVLHHSVCRQCCCTQACIMKTGWQTCRPATSYACRQADSGKIAGACYRYTVVMLLLPQQMCAWQSLQHQYEGFAVVKTRPVAMVVAPTTEHMTAPMQKANPNAACKT